MFEDLQIVIPSRSRPHSQKTVAHLSDNLWSAIKVVVPHDQEKEYRYHLPVDVEVIPFHESDGVGHKREFILHLKPTGKLIMLDDDLRFYRRTPDGDKFPPTSKAETERMITEIAHYLDSYAMVGLTDKFMSQTKPRAFVECQRFNQVLGFNRDLLPQPWPKFRMPHDEEHDVHLQLLTRGIKTAVITEWSKSDTPGALGGCSEWRNTQTMRETHEKLVELWPGIVTITRGAGPARARYNWQEAKRIGGLLS